MGIIIQYDNNGLRDDLQAFVITVQQYSVWYGFLFEFMYKSGCRLSELTTPNNIILNQNGTFTVLAKKGGNNRTFTQDELGKELSHYLVDDINVFTACNNSTASYYFKCFFPNYPVFVSGKIITTHLFRHSIIKSMYDLNYTLEQISIFIGERDTKNTQGYIDSLLTYFQKSN